MQELSLDDPVNSTSGKVISTLPPCPSLLRFSLKVAHLVEDPTILHPLLASVGNVQTLIIEPPATAAISKVCSSVGQLRHLQEFGLFHPNLPPLWGSGGPHFFKGSPALTVGPTEIQQLSTSIRTLHFVGVHRNFDLNELNRFSLNELGLFVLWKDFFDKPAFPLHEDEVPKLAGRIKRFTFNQKHFFADSARKVFLPNGIEFIQREPLTL